MKSSISVLKDLLDAVESMNCNEQSLADLPQRLNQRQNS